MRYFSDAALPELFPVSCHMPKHTQGHLSAPLYKCCFFSLAEYVVDERRNRQSGNEAGTLLFLEKKQTQNISDKVGGTAAHFHLIVVCTSCQLQITLF